MLAVNSYQECLGIITKKLVLSAHHNVASLSAREKVLKTNRSEKE